MPHANTSLTAQMIILLRDRVFYFICAAWIQATCIKLVPGQRSNPDQCAQLRRLKLLPNLLSTYPSLASELKEIYFHYIAVH